MTLELQDKNLILSDRVEEYDGTTAVLRTKMPPFEIEFMRWRAERWMKARHMRVAFFHDPWFVLRNGARMFGHTFRGCSLKSLIGLEDERSAYARYRSIRVQERAYI